MKTTLFLILLSISCTLGAQTRKIFHKMHSGVNVTSNMALDMHLGEMRMPENYRKEFDRRIKKREVQGQSQIESADSTSVVKDSTITPVQADSVTAPPDTSSVKTEVKPLNLEEKRIPQRKVRTEHGNSKPDVTRTYANVESNKPGKSNTRYSALFAFLLLPAVLVVGLKKFMQKRG